MIGKVNGLLDEILEDYILINVNNISYIIYCNVLLFSNENIGNIITLFTTTIIKEEIPVLYGFIQKEELLLFKQLITIQGVGAKMALNIVNNLDIHIIVSAVASKNDKIFTTISGIGSKIATRIVNELSIDKLRFYIDDIKNNLNDVISALVNLGFNRQDVLIIVKKLTPGLSIEEMIKFSLIELTNKSIVKV
jgi:Holliday junction DNA helicase RuvA